MSTQSGSTGHEPVVAIGDRHDSWASYGLSQKSLTFKARVQLLDGSHRTYEFPSKYTVDRIKAEIFAYEPSLKEQSKLDFQLALSEDERLRVEFIKLRDSHESLRAAIDAGHTVNILLLARPAQNTASERRRQVLRTNSFANVKTPLAHGALRKGVVSISGHVGDVATGRTSGPSLFPSASPAAAPHAAAVSAPNTPEPSKANQPQSPTLSIREKISLANRSASEAPISTPTRINISPSPSRSRSKKLLGVSVADFRRDKESEIEPTPKLSKSGDMKRHATPPPIKHMQLLDINRPRSGSMIDMPDPKDNARGVRFDNLDDDELIRQRIEQSSREDTLTTSSSSSSSRDNAISHSSSSSSTKKKEKSKDKDKDKKKSLKEKPVDDVKEMLRKKKKNSRSLGLGATSKESSQIGLGATPKESSQIRTETPIPRLKYMVGHSTPELLQRGPKTTREVSEEDSDRNTSPSDARPGMNGTRVRSMSIVAPETIAGCFASDSHMKTPAFYQERQELRELKEAKRRQQKAARGRGYDQAGEVSGRPIRTSNDDVSLEIVEEEDYRFLSMSRTGTLRQKQLEEGILEQFGVTPGIRDSGTLRKNNTRGRSNSMLLTTKNTVSPSANQEHVFSGTTFQQSISEKKRRGSLSLAMPDLVAYDRLDLSALSDSDLEDSEFSTTSSRPSTWRKSWRADAEQSLPLMRVTKGWWVEVGNPLLSPRSLIDPDFLVIDNSANDILFYKKYYAMYDHQNYLAIDEKSGPYMISVVREVNQNNSNSKLIRVLCRSRKGDDRKCVQEKLVSIKGIFGKTASINLILKACYPWVSRQKVQIIKSPLIVDELLNFEARQQIQSYKFGVLFCKEGQTKEEEMFSNEYGNEAFDSFLQFLGSKVRLKGWLDYRGGLDCVGNTTGTHSIYSKWRDYEIMFHVSTLLPYSFDNPQQLERKRHLGNDIVVLIFKEGNTPYLPDTIASDFNHVVAVVQPVQKKDKTMYRLSVSSKDGVPPFGPEIPEPAVFEKNDVFRDFLLCKLVNGERAAYKAPAFSEKIARTRYIMLKDLEEKFYKL